MSDKVISYRASIKKAAGYLMGDCARILVGGLIFLASLIAYRSAGAQLIINNMEDGVTIAQIEAALIGDGLLNVTIPSGKVEGTEIQIGIFSQGSTILGMESGVVISNGKVKDAANTANTTLNNGLGINVSPSNIPGLGVDCYDPVILPIEVYTGATMLSIRYVYGSDEYFSTSYEDSGHGVVGELDYVPISNFLKHPIDGNSPIYSSLFSGSFLKLNYQPSGTFMGTYMTEMNGFTPPLVSMGYIPKNQSGQKEIINLVLCDENTYGSRDSWLFFQLTSLQNPHKLHAEFAPISDEEYCPDDIIPVYVNVTNIFDETITNVRIEMLDPVGAEIFDAPSAIASLDSGNTAQFIFGIRRTSNTATLYATAVGDDAYSLMIAATPKWENRPSCLLTGDVHFDQILPCVGTAEFEVSLVVTNPNSEPVTDVMPSRLGNSPEVLFVSGPVPAGPLTILANSSTTFVYTYQPANVPASTNPVTFSFSVAGKLEGDDVNTGTIYSDPAVMQMAGNLITYDPQTFYGCDGKSFDVVLRVQNIGNGPVDEVFPSLSTIYGKSGGNVEVLAEPNPVTIYDLGPGENHYFTWKVSMDLTNTYTGHYSQWIKTQWLLCGELGPDRMETYQASVEHDRTLSAIIKADTHVCPNSELEVTYTLKNLSDVPINGVKPEILVTGPGSLVSGPSATIYYDFTPGQQYPLSFTYSVSGATSGTVYFTPSVTTEPELHCLTTHYSIPAMTKIVDETGLIAIVSTPAVVATGQIFEVRLDAETKAPATNLTAQLWVSATLVDYQSGPVPASVAKLMPEVVQSFTWVYKANQTGSVTFSGSVTGTSCGSFVWATSTPQSTVLAAPPCLDDPENLMAVKEGEDCEGGDWQMISLSWQAPSTTCTVVGFDVWRDDVKLNASVITASFYVDNPPNPGTGYNYTVVAIDEISGLAIGSKSISTLDAECRMIGWPYRGGDRANLRSSPVDIQEGLNLQWSIPGQNRKASDRYPLIDKYGILYSWSTPDEMDYWLNAIDPESGTIMWTLTNTTPNTNMVMDPEGSLYGTDGESYGSLSFGVHAIPKSATLPQPKWTVTLTSGVGAQPITMLPDGSLLICYGDHELPADPPREFWSVNTTDGSINWTVTPTVALWGYSAVDGLNRLYISEGTNIAAYQMYKDGSPLTQYPSIDTVKYTYTNTAGSSGLCSLSKPYHTVTPEGDYILAITRALASWGSDSCYIDTAYGAADPYMETSLWWANINNPSSDPLGEYILLEEQNMNLFAGADWSTLGMSLAYINGERFMYMGRRDAVITSAKLAVDAPEIGYFWSGAPYQGLLYMQITTPTISNNRYLIFAASYVLYERLVGIFDLSSETVGLPYDFWIDETSSTFGLPAVIGPSGEWYITDYAGTLRAFSFVESAGLGDSSTRNLTLELPVYLYTLSLTDVGTDKTLKAPQGVSAASGGYVAVADTGNSRVAIFTDEGNPEGGIGRLGRGEGNFRYPEAVAVAAGADGFLYVADTSNDRIQVIRNNDVLFSFGEKGSGDGEFDSPRGIGTHQSGRIFVADTGNNRIQAFSEDGQFILSFGKAGTGEGQFSGPVGVAVDKTGEVFVADRGNERIQVFTLDGEYLRTLDPRKGLDSPSDVAIGPDGLLYVSTSGHQVVVLDPQSGDQLGAIGGFGAGSGEFDSPSGLSWNLNGKLLYVADTGNDRIEVYGYGKKGAKAAPGQAASDRPTGLTLPAGSLPGTEPSGTGPGTVVPGEEPTTPPAPGQLALQGLAVSPNPFDPRSGEVLAISFGVNKGANVNLVIRDRFGRIAYESAMQEVQAGSVLLEWNGRTMGGTYAPPGVYSVSVEVVAGGESAMASVEVTVAAKGEGGPIRKGSPRERARTQGQ